jgi:hypothetical protein
MHPQDRARSAAAARVAGGRSALPRLDRIFVGMLLYGFGVGESSTWASTSEVQKQWVSTSWSRVRLDRHPLGDSRLSHRQRHLSALCQSYGKVASARDGLTDESGDACGGLRNSPFKRRTRLSTEGPAALRREVAA